MAQNYLQLNASKTEVVLFGPSDSSGGIANLLGPLAPYLHSHARNLGVIFDSALKFDKQINSVVKGCYFHLRNIAKLKPLLSFNNLKTVTTALISPHLDYCNALYLSVSQSSLSRLQLVQNAAARLITGTRKRDSITPILASLHWLPVKYRTEFKVLLFVFKALHGLAPQYISELICPLHNTRSLRSSGQLLLAVPRSRLRGKGDRAFAVAAPKLWNSLPLE